MTEKTRFGFTDSGETGRYSAVECSGRMSPFRLGEKMIPKMTQVMRTLLLLVALVFAWPALADYYDGLREWDAGRYRDALVKWQKAAGEGDARSMLALGKLFVQGLGAPQDYIEAHKWFNLAASHGLEEAIAERDALAEKMTPVQLATAQERAASWQPATREEDPATSEADTETSEAETAASEATPATSEAGPGPPPERAIREAQSLLTALGYEVGEVDGVWNEATAKVYRQFLIDANQPETDSLTPEGLRAIRAIAKRRGIRAGTVTESDKPKPRDGVIRGIKAETVTESEKQAPRDIVVLAARAGDVDGMQKALAAGADVNARDVKGWTALMRMADQGSMLLVEPLLASGADPNLRLADGATALFIAVVRGHAEITAALAKADADPMIKGPKGKTVLEVARSHRDPALLAALGIRQAGEVFRDCETCPEMVVIPAGSFMMGSPAGEKDRDDDEGPQHQVTLAEPFAVGKYEVTRGEYASFARATGRRHGNSCWTYEGGEYKERADRSWRNPGFTQGENHPVVCVHWDDAGAYVNWISRETGKNYRLLSESEWEYAARGGTQTRYSWGDAIGRNRANCAGCGSRWDGEKTAPVGSFSANEFGLYDMHGNVREWTQDCWNDSYTGAPKDGRTLD